MEAVTEEVIVDEVVIKTDCKTIYGKIYKPGEPGIYPAVIVSHGYNGSNSDHVDDCICFAKNGYIAYAYDFCGGSTHSKSSGKTKNMTLFTEMQDLLDVYEFVYRMKDVNKRQIFLFGASQGGMVSALVAEELKNRVAGLILYYPAFCIPDNLRETYPVLKDIPETVELWGMIFGRNFASSIHNLKIYNNIGLFTKNVLIVYGEYDPIVPKWYMTKAKKVYKNAELVMMKNEGHGFSSIGSERARNTCVTYLKAHGGKEFKNNTFKEIPIEYWEQPCLAPGKIVSFNYETVNNLKQGRLRTTKEALVYLPFGYDENDKETKYNVLYLMHGGSDSPNWFFNGVGEDSNCKTIVDNLIANGRMKPLIICAVSYYNNYSSDATSNCKYFYLELTKDIMPIFEKRYHVNASREHRAFGGFSMGAMTTWSVFENCLNQFEYFLPISGDSWALGEKGGGSNPEETAHYLAKKVVTQGYSASDFTIYSGCGSNDVAEPNLTPQIQAMKKVNTVFYYTDNFSTGNLYECIIEKGGHDRGTVQNVLYNALPKFFD